jgi:hypothetical protein
LSLPTNWKCRRGCMEAAAAKAGSGLRFSILKAPAGRHKVAGGGAPSGTTGLVAIYP